MNKEMLDILNDLSKKPTTGLALQIMELSSENLILEQQTKEQQEVIDNVINIINQHFKHHPELLTENQIEYELIRKIENILKEALK